MKHWDLSDWVSWENRWQKNLINAGYSLVVLDVFPEPIQELVDMGATAAKTPAEVASQAKKIITMLPDGPDVEKVVLGENGIVETATAETKVIDMTSISPTVSLKVAAALKEKGAQALDAPVSGGEPGAISGELAIMVGGSEALFNEAKPIFDVLGKSAVLVGDTGAGQTTKLANQILVGVHIQAMGEAMLLACKAGCDPVKVFNAIKGGLAGSNVLNAKVPMVVERNFKAGFKIKLHQKDLRNALEAASSMSLNLPATEMVKGYIDTLVDQGHGEEDHGGVVQVLESNNGAIIKK